MSVNEICLRAMRNGDGEAGVCAEFEALMADATDEILNSRPAIDAIFNDQCTKLKTFAKADQIAIAYDEFSETRFYLPGIVPHNTAKGDDLQIKEFKRHKFKDILGTTDLMYAFHLVMQEISDGRFLGNEGFQILLGTKFSLYDHEEANKASAIRNQVTLFTKIPKITPELMINFMVSHFYLNETVLESLDWQKISGRAFFFFSLFIPRWCTYLHEKNPSTHTEEVTNSLKVMLDEAHIEAGASLQKKIAAYLSAPNTIFDSSPTSRMTCECFFNAIFNLKDKILNTEKRQEFLTYGLGVADFDKAGFISAYNEEPALITAFRSLFNGFPPFQDPIYCYLLQKTEMISNSDSSLGFLLEQILCWYFVYNTKPQPFISEPASKHKSDPPPVLSLKTLLEPLFPINFDFCIEDVPITKQSYPFPADQKGIDVMDKSAYPESEVLFYNIKTQLGPDIIWRVGGQDLYIQVKSNLQKNFDFEKALQVLNPGEMLLSAEQRFNGVKQGDAYCSHLRPKFHQIYKEQKLDSTWNRVIFSLLPFSQEAVTTINKYNVKAKSKIILLQSSPTAFGNLHNLLLKLKGSTSEITLNCAPYFRGIE